MKIQQATDVDGIHIFLILEAVDTWVWVVSLPHSVLGHARSNAF